MTHTGQCYCGAIAYRLDGEIIETNHCDCRGCQRAHGSFRVPWVVTRRADLTVTRGADTLQRVRNRDLGGCEAHGEREICPQCGTHLFWTSDDGRVFTVAGATFDDPSFFALYTRQGTVNREDGRVWIGGFRGFGSGEFCSSVHGAQFAAMRAIGGEVTYAQLLGASGLAFRMQVHEAICPSSPHSCCGFRCLDGSGKALAWKTRIFHPGLDPANDTQEARAERVATTRAAVKASIDRGIPVAYGSWEDGNIVGYADDGAQWLCVHPYFRDGKEVFVMGESGSEFADCEGGMPWGVLVFTEPKAGTEIVSPRELALDSMRQAVAMWESDPVEAYILGDAAWQHWIDWVNGFDADGETSRAGMHGNRWIYVTLWEYRTAAAAWLRECGDILEPAMRGDVATAANHYLQLAALLLDGKDHVWEAAPPGGKPEAWSVEVRQRYCDLLEAARAHDRAAIAALRKALDAMEAAEPEVAAVGN